MLVSSLIGLNSRATMDIDATVQALHRMIHKNHLKYLSILDELHKAHGTKRLNISQYTFYDEEEKCYTNMRIQYILNDYHNIDWKDTEDLDDIRLLLLVILLFSYGVNKDMKRLYLFRRKP